MSHAFSPVLKQITPEQLIQVHLKENPGDFMVGTVLEPKAEMLVLGMVDQMGNDDGIGIISIEDIAYLKTASLYLQSFASKPATKSSLNKNQQLWKEIAADNLAACLTNAAKKQMLLEVVDESGMGLTGKVVTCQNRLLTLDEYSGESPQRFAQVQLPLARIKRVNVNSLWLRSLSLSLK